MDKTGVKLEAAERAVMVEVEMKFPATSFSSVLERLQAWGAKKNAVLQEEDHYFNAPDRDFASTDEAFRVRRIGQKNFVTYKGPKRDSLTKTRTEIEVELMQGDETANSFMRLLTSLGFRPVSVVRKRREIHTFLWEEFEAEVCLDVVEGLGEFVEVEFRVPDDRVDVARAALLRLAAALGLEASERRSYLELQLAARGDKSAR
jgi:adenylate cyclase class 2